MSRVKREARPRYKIVGRQGLRRRGAYDTHPLAEGGVSNIGPKIAPMAR